MTVYNVTYLGESGLLDVPLSLALAVRRWPVTLTARKERSVPKSWSAEQIELARYNAEAVRALVALARELRAGRPCLGRGDPGKVSLVCSSERADMLSRMFVVDNPGTHGERKILVDGKKVAVRVRDRDAVEAWRLVARRSGAAKTITDEYEVGTGSDKLLCRVAPRVLSRTQAELYGALRSEGIAISEALVLVEALSAPVGAG